jgi:co-chaperonin GroES (HSP10)
MKTRHSKITVTGFNVLVSRHKPEAKSAGGIHLPDSSQNASDIQKGHIVEKGPGLIIPPMPISVDGASDIDAMLKEVTDSKAQIKYMALDVEVNDIVYYMKNAADVVELDGVEYDIVPYPAIKLIERLK